MKVTVIRDVDTLRAATKAIVDHPLVSYDIETQTDSTEGSNLEDWHPSSRIVSASFTVGHGIDEVGPTFVAPLAHPVGIGYAENEDPKRDAGWTDILYQLAEAMLHSKTKLIAQNGKYDVRWTYSMVGVPLEELLWFDPMAASYALDENQPKNLGALTEQYLGLDSHKGMVDLRNADRAPWRQLAHYNALDTIRTYLLAKPMLDALKEDARVARIYHYILIPITRELVRIERTGMRPDPEAMAARLDASVEALEVATRNLLAYAEKFFGKEKLEEAEVNWNANSKFFKAFMAASGAPVYEHSPKTGQPSWNKSVLKRLADEGAEYVKHLLTYREHEKDIGFLKAWQEFSQRDGRIHPTFNPMRFITADDQEKGTVTGRLSSSNPNAQQIPKRLKTVFGPEDGWLFVEADYAQIELRVGAMVFKEKNMLAAFERGDDLHRLFASDLTGKDPEEITDLERFYAKAGNFGFLYGMGAGGFVKYAYNTYGLDVDIMEAQKIRESFFSRWNRLEDAHDRVMELARVKGYAVSPLGRIRRVPDIHSDNPYLRSRAERQAINSVVQSCASDLMLLTLIDLGKVLDPDKAQVVGTVHDSILFEVRKDVVHDILEQVANIMLYPDTKRRFGAEITVPLSVEFSVGKRWADERAKTIELGG